MTTSTIRTTARAISITAAALGLAVLLPFLFHLLPVHGGVPPGARWLPIFYAPLLVLAIFGWRWALVPALAAPSLNHLLTGRPAAELLGMLTLELALFVSLLALAARRSPRLLMLAPLSYVLAKLLASTFLGIPWEATVAALQRALPGIGALFALGTLAAYSPVLRRRA
ncbi:MAG: hypothetical protein KGZ60_07945 [Truepera sp.]|nr:hypothetical protein [Truepera sp.]